MKNLTLTLLTSLALLSSCTKEEESLTPVCEDECGTIIECTSYVGGNGSRQLIIVRNECGREFRSWLNININEGGYQGYVEEGQTICIPVYDQEIITYGN
tara:strand:+ start:124 stop:423 length:300 start_codon:yes stop_codon:yes gene_type:complete